MHQRHSARSPVVARIIASIIALFCGCAFAQSAPPSYVFSGPLLPLLLQVPENGWLRVNANLFSDVWTPPELEPLDNGATHPPSKIILAWSGFAWDSNRGDLWIYGGGHENYSGNDTYRWRSSTLRWERTSYPSEIRQDPVAGFQAVDGVDNAPASAHTYDNNIFLSVADRFLTWGGATYSGGQPYWRVSESDPTKPRITGPYLFDPTRADGNKVGGTTGSHVMRVAPHPEIVGGQMWANRDMPKWLAGQSMPGAHVSGCAIATVENGKDVSYVAGSAFIGAGVELYRYQLTDLANPALDQITKIGSLYNGTTGTTTCGYDPVKKLFVRTGTNSAPFEFWDLTAPGPTNPTQFVAVESTIASFQAWLAAQSFNIQNCALKFDAIRRVYPIWCGGPTMWELHAPASGNTTTGWTMAQRPAPATTTPTTSDQAIGVLGKFRYAPYFDAFVVLEDINRGDVWIYKPAGWVQPNVAGNALPTVSLTSPAAGATYAPRNRVDLKSTAVDPDGTIARVEYYVNGVKVGQSTTGPTYTVSINPVLVGTYTVTAVAVDNLGGMAKSGSISFNVAATLLTSVMQRGQNGYNGVTDTFMDAFAPSTNRGTYDPLYLDGSLYNPLVRFAIFQSEGGPVPDGAILQSATLSLYKQYYNEPLQANALLRAWSETQSTWSVAQTGVPWSAGGAAGAGSDYATPPDATVTPDFNPGWVSFDVTGRVQRWSDHIGVNNGWRLSQTVAGGNPKTFYSSEDAANPTLRPRLSIVYSIGSSNAPPTVSISTPAPNASVALGGSFTLTASASDSDGIAKVEYFANGVSLGVAPNVSPYALTWTPAATGNYSLTAIATDSLGAAATSTPVSVSVTPAANTTTVVLQRGLNGYAGVTDTFLDGYLTTAVRGAYNPLYLDALYAPLLRFAIFQSEGGPVPNNATVQSATLSLNKGYYGETVRLNALLKPWVESQANWTLSQAGVPWSAPGAAGAGSDFAASADASVAVGFNPGWVDFDVTPRVVQWGAGAANYGWRMAQSSSTPGNAKVFNSSEETANTALRPKLTVVYSVNQPPTVSLTSPKPNASIPLGASFTLQANASDSNGIGKVEYFANGVSVGVAPNVSPYTLSWTPAAAGSYALTAVATDGLGASTTSAPVSVTVTLAVNTTTVVLQRGLNGYGGVTDTFLDGYLQNVSRGSYDPLYLDALYAPLVRFAIYYSEGGPVPNDATLLSATLSLNKGYYSETVRLNALLKSWSESQANWTLARAGVPWSVAGAAGAGSDYVTSPDASVAVGFNPGWVNFDITSRVAQWATTNTNYGWRMAQSSTTAGNAKVFDSSEESANTALRPKLTIVYSGGTVSPAPSVAMTSPAANDSIALGGSFTLQANASDSNGIAKVEYFANGVSIGVGAASSPYTLAWTPGATGSYSLTAVATDTFGLSTTSAAIPVSVTPGAGVTTVVLQRGLNGYSGAADTFLDGYLQTAVRGNFDPLYLDALYNPLLRFAIFQSEGGPVPNNATIVSATLSLNKGYYAETVRLNALLKPWLESQASWSVSQTGIPWSVPGASGAGTDYVSSADASVAVAFNPGWVNFDVTPRVTQWAAGAANYGWRVAQSGTVAGNAKVFDSSEEAANPSLRPKLTVVYR